MNAEQVSQRWLDHYSSNPASIWSSATMNTNLTSSMGRPTTAAAAAHAQRAASQGTLFDAAATAPPPVEAPAHNALVIEKGMLRLCPPKRRGSKGGARADPGAVDGAERSQEQKERQPIEALDIYPEQNRTCVTMEFAQLHRHVGRPYIHTWRFNRTPV